MYLNNNLSKLVPRIINKYIKAGYKIEIKITPVDYTDTSFSRAAHRLALAEISEIVKFQKKDSVWNKNYKIEIIRFDSQNQRQSKRSNYETTK